MKRFSITYSAYHQRRFLELISAGDLEQAIEKLEGMPSGITPIEEAERLRVKIEGYRMIVNKNVIKLTGEMLNLKAYEKIGTLEEFEALKEAYRSLQNL